MTSTEVAEKSESMQGPTLQFWYEFASTYSYLTAIRIDDMARAARVEVLWRPFLLGPIFQAQGWTTSPFNIYPAKGRYMVRDITRIATSRGHHFVMPKVFPANGLLAARVALAGEADGWTGAFTRAVFEAQFTHGADIADAGVLKPILSGLGLDADAALDAANATANKERLRTQSTEAQRLGIFGSPTLVTADGELFWGDDRLEQALAWACRTH